MENLKLKIKKMGQENSCAALGMIVVPHTKTEQDVLAEGIIYQHEEEFQKVLNEKETLLTECEAKQKDKGDVIDVISRQLSSNFNYSPLFFWLTGVLTLGMMIFAYAFYCSAFYNAFIMDITDLQGLDESSMGHVFSIFNKNAFESVNIHLLVGSVFLGFSLLVEHYLASNKIRPLLVISVILFIADILLIIQVERKTSMMAELIGFDRPTDGFFYMTLIMFGFVSCFVLGVLLNLLSKYSLGFKSQIFKKQMSKAGNRAQNLKAEISILKLTMNDLRNFSKQVIIQWYMEGINEHLISRGYSPLNITVGGNGIADKREVEGIRNL
jgi:uncharacterized membrane protein